MAVKTTATKKTSTAAEIVVGAAAQNIVKAIAELKTATEGVAKLAETSEALTLQVANKEDELVNLVIAREETIKALDVTYAEKERQLNVNLDLSFKSNTKSVVDNYLASVKETSISIAELKSLRDALAEATASSEKAIQTAVASATSSMKSQYENDLKIIHSENKAVTATITAQLDSLKSEKAALQLQNDKLYNQIDLERTASIERAKAGSVGSINVAPASK